MKRAALATIAGLVGLVGLVSPASAMVDPSAPSGPVAGDPVLPQIGEPAEVAACRDGISQWRIYGHLVVAFETCELTDDLGHGDTLVLLLDERGNPAQRCDWYGGRWEYIGSPAGFHLHICWEVDY